MWFLQGYWNNLLKTSLVKYRLDHNFHTGSFFHSWGRIFALSPVEFRGNMRQNQGQKISFNSKSLRVNSYITSVIHEFLELFSWIYKGRLSSWNLSPETSGLWKELQFIVTAAAQAQLKWIMVCNWTAHFVIFFSEHFK